MSFQYKDRPLIESKSLVLTWSLFIKINWNEIPLYLFYWQQLEVSRRVRFGGWGSNPATPPPHESRRLLFQDLWLKTRDLPKGKFRHTEKKWRTNILFWRMRRKTVVQNGIWCSVGCNIRRRVLWLKICLSYDFNTFQRVWYSAYLYSKLNAGCIQWRNCLFGGGFWKLQN